MSSEEIIYEYQQPDRLVIIGDIHGDIKRFKNILIDAKIINANIEWIAEPKNTIVIQMGDQIDSLNRTTDNDWEVIEDIEMIIGVVAELNCATKIKKIKSTAIKSALLRKAISLACFSCSPVKLMAIFFGLSNFSAIVLILSFTSVAL